VTLVVVVSVVIRQFVNSIRTNAKQQERMTPIFSSPSRKKEY